MDNHAPSGDNIALSLTKPIRLNSIPWWLWLIPIVLLS